MSNKDIFENNFREYDIRGIVGKTLSNNTAFLIGKGFSTLVKKNMSIEDLSKKVLKIEHQIYPSIVHLFAKKEIGIKNKKVFIKNEIKRNFFIKNL